jgi:hypothetical protein
MTGTRNPRRPCGQPAAPALLDARTRHEAGEIGDDELRALDDDAIAAAVPTQGRAGVIAEQSRRRWSLTGREGDAAASRLREPKLGRGARGRRIYRGPAGRWRRAA